VTLASVGSCEFPKTLRGSPGIAVKEVGILFGKGSYKDWPLSSVSLFRDRTGVGNPSDWQNRWCQFSHPVAFTFAHQPSMMLMFRQAVAPLFMPLVPGGFQRAARLFSQTCVRIPEKTIWLRACTSMFLENNVALHVAVLAQVYDCW